MLTLQVAFPEVFCITLLEVTSAKKWKTSPQKARLATTQLHWEQWLWTTVFIGGFVLGDICVCKKEVIKCNVGSSILNSINALKMAFFKIRF